MRVTQKLIDLFPFHGKLQRVSLHGKKVDGYLLSHSKLSKQNPYYRELAIDYDRLGYCDPAIGKELESLFDDDYVIAIHRTGYTKINQNILNDMFHNGLMCSGQSMQGARREKEFGDIELTSSHVSNSIILIGSLKTASGYKDSDGSIILKIPKSYLGEKEGEVKPIYYPGDSSLRLLSEYIYGYIPCDNHNLTSVIKNPNYQNTHTYQNTGLIYDISVFDKVCSANKKK